MQANYKYKQIMGAAPQGRELHTKFGNMNINNVEIGSLTMFAEQKSLPYSSKHNPTATSGKLITCGHN